MQDHAYTSTRLSRRQIHAHHSPHNARLAVTERITQPHCTAHAIVVQPNPPSPHLRLQRLVDVLEIFCYIVSKCDHFIIVVTRTLLPLHYHDTPQQHVRILRSDGLEPGSDGTAIFFNIEDCEYEGMRAVEVRECVGTDLLADFGRIRLRNFHDVVLAMLMRLASHAAALLGSQVRLGFTHVLLRALASFQCFREVALPVHPKDRSLVVAAEVIPIPAKQ